MEAPFILPVSKFAADDPIQYTELFVVASPPEIGNDIKSVPEGR